MENINSMFVNNIIHYFEQPAAGVKPKNQVFILTIVYLLFINEVFNCMANVRITDTMLKSRMIKLNVIFKHLINVILLLFIVKRQSYNET